MRWVITLPEKPEAIWRALIGQCVVERYDFRALTAERPQDPAARRSVISFPIK